MNTKRNYFLSWKPNYIKTSRIYSFNMSSVILLFSINDTGLTKIYYSSRQKNKFRFLCR